MLVYSFEQEGVAEGSALVVRELVDDCPENGDASSLVWSEGGLKKRTHHSQDGAETGIR